MHLKLPFRVYYLNEVHQLIIQKFTKNPFLVVKIYHAKFLSSFSSFSSIYSIYPLYSIYSLYPLYSLYSLYPIYSLYSLYSLYPLYPLYPLLPIISASFLKNLAYYCFCILYIFLTFCFSLDIFKI
jgi:hypothetical protein